MNNKNNNKSEEAVSPFPKVEEDVLRFWQSNKIFEK